MTLDEAISKRMQENTAQRDAGPTFEPDPDLEDWGRKLDVLQANDPQAFGAVGLKDIRTRVATYRTRKALHEEKQ